MRARLLFSIGIAGAFSWLTAVPASARTLALRATATTTTTSTAASGAATTSTTATTTTTTTPPSDSVIHLSGIGQVAFVAIVIGVFALLWFVLILYDRIRTTTWRETEYTRMLNTLIAEAKPATGESLTPEDVQGLAKAIQQPPKGIQGLTRTLLALGLLTLVGVALVSLLVGNPNNASDELKTVITALTTALITIIGFYFGARTAQTSDTSHPKTPATSAPAGGAPTGSSPAPTKPQITTQPADQSVKAGATATFTAAATGTPTPVVQWQVEAAGATGFVDIAGATAPEFTLATTTDADDGNKYCVLFSNAAGSVVSDAATLTVT